MKFLRNRLECTTVFGTTDDTNFTDGFSDQSVASVKSVVALLIATLALTACAAPRHLVALSFPSGTPAPMATDASRTPQPTWTLPVTRPAPSPTPLLTRSSTPSPTDTPQPAPTLVPSATASVTCADLDGAWAAADWPRTLAVLEQLTSANVVCGAEPLAEKQYAAHINYALALEQRNQTQAAVEHYRVALAVNGRGHEALTALIRLNALPEPTPPPCLPGDLAPYVPTSSTEFVRAEGETLLAGDEPLTLRGVNYYPRHAAWDKFLTASDPEEMTAELDVIAAAGLNTLRVFLWYDPLFTCAPEDARPNPAVFARFDDFIARAHAHGFRLIVTLNDLPDLIFRPLYTDWPRYDAQTAFIVSRYQNEPAILAWDLRNEGDLDYDDFGRAPVQQWLTHVAEVVRANDARHLLTAGWFSNAADTAAVVDVLSFHHWRTAAELAARIERLRAVTDQPIVLEEVGYPSAGNWDEAAQAKRLSEVLGLAEENHIAGWLVWAAFDFPPADPRSTNPEYYYGLWRLDLTAKSALEVLPLK